jgi:pimeloyl-ACP methyl ester carboxylesterase
MNTMATAEYTAITVPTQFVEAKGIRFAYRRWGKKGKLPLVFNQHYTGNLDNWDPAVLDGLAKEREVIIFNNAGVASSTGEVPNTFAGMAKNAEVFIDAHSDVATKDGLFPGISSPRVPGHEVAGIIDKAGAGVNGWAAGERVGVGWDGGGRAEETRK